MQDSKLRACGGVPSANRLCQVARISGFSDRTRAALSTAVTADLTIPEPPREARAVIAEPILPAHCLYVQDYRELTSPHYLLRSDLPPDSARAELVKFEALYDILARFARLAEGAGLRFGRAIMERNLRWC